MNTSQVDLSQLAIDRTPEDSGRAPLRFRKHLVTRYLIPGVLLIGFLGLVVWAARDVVFPPLQVRVVPVLVNHDVVRAGGTPLFNAAGWIEPRPTAIRVPGLAPGVVEQLLVVEDQAVTAGEPVAELIKDDARLEWEMAMAENRLREADLDHARVALTAARTRFAQPVHLEAELAEAESALATIQTSLANLPFEQIRAAARLKYAENDYQRNVDARNSVSRREIEEAATVVETMQAMVDELRLRESSLQAEVRAITARRDALREQLELLVDEIQSRDQAEAAVAASRARLQQSTVRVAEAKLKLDRMTIRAPVDGRILLLLGQPGTRIGGMRDAMNDAFDGSTVVTMYRPDMLQIKVDVRFEDIPQVSLGQPVRVDNPALDEPLTGTVLFISSEADIQKNTLEVKVAIDMASPVFKPEMLVDVTFLAAAPGPDNSSADPETRWRLFAPADLVRQQDGQSMVWIADRSAGVARQVTVATGQRNPDGTVEIESGLDVSTRLIQSPVDNLHDGQRIQITGEGK